MKENPVNRVVYLGIMLEAASNERPSTPDIEKGLLFFGIFILAIGLVSVFYPRFFWYLRIGRKIKGAAPDRLYLNVLRIGGVLVCAVALLIFMQSC